ncbi:hypothetical protein LTR36_004289 [Oleoguttula mirabilis]|uniref:Postreplication repair E3 ubiquitin-protein ligase RAD18 n=1 Tax=Oleoguttula mirabilis TaxID=1507867 RepID=A0AAV9JGC8_9PEZI|nr:hypothetical protein LTR36_004289 [Oleoguttula mirabilis]
MDSAQDIADSTDWLNTPLKDFAQLENALHCQICKEFYDTPMITSCAHTFCSKCIRTSLSADGKCPACRTADQASKLRNNWALQEVVATFQAARPEAISVARREQAEAAQAKRPGKRKRAVLDSDDMEEAAHEGRTTRSKSRRVAASQTSQTDPVEIDDTDAEDEFEPEQPDDGLVECLLGCGKRMMIEQVEPHLDRCEDEKKQERRARTRTPVSGLGSSRSASAQSTRPQDRISELNYSLLRDNAMRKKLEEIGIPGWGSKQLMVKRHTEWVNLWNANCDSNHPRTKRELLHDLDSWERTQGGRAPNTQTGLANGVMRKDFDGNGWASKNKDEFSRLIADARRKKSNPATASSPPKEADLPEDASKPALTGDEGSSSHFPPPSPPQPVYPQLPTEDSQPYADNPEAMASIREKVEAANAGRHIEPVMNAGFRSPDSHPHPEHVPFRAAAVDAMAPPPASLTRKPSDPPPGSQNPALLEQSHFGHDAEPASRKSSTDELAAQHRTSSPRDVSARLSSTPKKVPMFAVPQSPVTDFDNGVH